ncbi:hypothetical protein HYFRA_00010650 [Hymenoscyphus fraxineus]|uniref:NACHT-NTPase and P-loop NTPases N-terminal domain-containing protein n=1 Tax=Hymenoscyphus fraxineus TaxID=746836 RepID=A0A9N9PUE4_9HELO|nr:hypothetical protein HYFRA_00010650 [Hymenoscyphus fraxineus]
MDGLSGAAGVIAVASIAIQLAEGIKKLCDFWESIKDAPEDIATLVQELRLLDLVLKKMHINEEKYGADPTTTAVLKRCAEKVNALVAAMDTFQPGFRVEEVASTYMEQLQGHTSKQKVPSFPAVVGRIENDIDPGTARSIRRRMQYTFLDQNLTAISEGFAGLQLKRSSTTVTTSTSGPLDINSHVVDLRAELERMTRAISSPLLKAGLQMGIDKVVLDLVESLKTNTIPRRPTESTTRSYSGHFESDVEKGTLTSMPPLLRKRSRRRKYQVKVGSSETLRESEFDHYEYETHFILHPA